MFNAGGGTVFDVVGMLPGPVRWALDLAVHWQWAYAALLVLACGVGLAATRKPRWLMAMAMAALPWFTASAPAPSSDSTSDSTSAALFTVASANVHVSATDATPWLRWLSAQRADVAVLLEVSPAFAASLQAVSSTSSESPASTALFPYRKVIPGDDPFGIAVLSRFPLENVRVVELAAGPQAIVATVRRDDGTGAGGGEGSARGPVALVALHTMPPLFGAPSLDTRDADVARLLNEAHARGMSAVVAGDFNASAWSRPLHAAASVGFRRATGLSPTWPGALAGLGGIPIDQVLVDDAWRVVESQRGESLGSDHLPVLVRLAPVD